jgi:hypothetical protein
MEVKVEKVRYGDLYRLTIDNELPVPLLSLKELKETAKKLATIVRAFEKANPPKVVMRTQCTCVFRPDQCPVHPRQMTPRPLLKTK